jgi:hypothetical protein
MGETVAQRRRREHEVRARALMTALVVGSLLLGCTGADAPDTSPSPSRPAASATPGEQTGTPPQQARRTLWLCHPDDRTSECARRIPTVVVTAQGTRRSVTAPAADPPLDCFYVYPTVSTAPTATAPRRITPELRFVVAAQAARFGSVCRVFAPVYRQVTLQGLATAFTDPKARELAHRDIVLAWRQYLDEDNDGRPFVLLGHSQGTFELTRLLREQIEPRPQLRDRLVSALLIGGSVSVPTGGDVGGSFRLVPACRSADQVGCVVAYNTFTAAPPNPSLFGRTLAPGQQILCVNPAAPQGGTAALDTVVPRDRGPAVSGLAVFPDAVQATCRSTGGASWLDVDRREVSALPPTVLQVDAAPAWGLHRLDVSLALDDLVTLVESQGRQWQRQRG